MCVCFSFVCNYISLCFFFNLSCINYSIIWKVIFLINDTHYNIILFLFLLNITTKIKMFLILILLCFFFLLTDVTNNFIYFSMYDINTSLTNGLAIIHPIIVLITYSYVLTKLFVSSKKIFNKKTIKNFFLLSFCGLFLGAWWAQQELNWGGWWNWDFVELFLFVFFIRSVLYIHILVYKHNFFIYIFNKNDFYYLILFFVCVRWDIVKSVHSFNTLSFLERYYLYVFFFFLCFFIYKNINFLYKQALFRRFFFFVKNKKYNIYINVFIFFVFIFYFYNVYCLVLFDTDFIELSYFLKIILLFVFLSVFYVYFFPAKSLFFFFIVCFFNNYFFVLLFFLLVYNQRFFKKKLNKHTLHTTILVVILIISYFSSLKVFIVKEFLNTNHFLSLHINFDLITNLIQDNKTIVLKNFLQNNIFGDYYLLYFFTITNNNTYTYVYTFFNTVSILTLFYCLLFLLLFVFFFMFYFLITSFKKKFLKMYVWI